MSLLLSLHEFRNILNIPAFISHVGRTANYGRHIDKYSSRHLGVFKSIRRVSQGKHWKVMVTGCTHSSSFLLEVMLEALRVQPVGGAQDQVFEDLLSIHLQDNLGE